MMTKLTATCVLKDANWTAITFAIERRKPLANALSRAGKDGDRDATVADPARGMSVVDDIIAAENGMT